MRSVYTLVFWLFVFTVPFHLGLHTDPDGPAEDVAGVESITFESTENGGVVTVPDGGK